jgi:hypothetical protein
VTTLVEPRDPGGILQHAAAVLGLGVDEFRDLPLPHKRRGMRPGGRVGEQHLHVPGAHVLAVQLVGAARVAGDAADDVDVIGVVEPGGRETLGIVDLDMDLGEVPGGTRGGPGEDHVLHPVAAHGGGTVFAHHPAQRLQQVRLAAPVGAHDAGQPLGDHEVRGIDE